MKQIVVGIPKALLFYYEKDLWIPFFERLGIRTLISNSTNKDILLKGENLSIDEACFSLKIYLGHVENLIGKCDYIFIPRMFSIKKGEQVCTNFNCLYDLVHNLYPKQKFIHYNIDVEKGKKEALAYISLGRQLGFSYLASYQAYLFAKEEQRKTNLEKLYEQEKKLNSKNMKVLLASHSYNLYDSYISEKIVSYLNDKNIEIIYSDIFDDRMIDQECREISSDVHWTHSKKLLAAINYYEPFVNGIIFLSSFPCGPDSLTMEMVKRKVVCPILFLIVENEFSETGVETRLESFFDILCNKQEVNYERNY